MKNLNKSIVLVVLLIFPVVSFGQSTNIGDSIESGGATKIEAGSEVKIIPDGTPMEIPIRYTDDIEKPKNDNNRFILKVGEKIWVSRAIAITLNSLNDKTANATVISVGGCGPITSYLCLGAPGFEETFDLKLGQPKIIPGTGQSLTFAQKISDKEGWFILTFSLIRDYQEKPTADSITFNLKAGEKRLVSKDLGGITVTLNSNIFRRLTGDTANVTVNVTGGCGPGTDDLCLGHPGLEETFDLNLGQTKKISGIGASLKFTQKISNNEARFTWAWTASGKVTPTTIPTTTPKPTTIKTFEDCVRAGYPVGQSYPATCWAPDGRHFVEKIIEDRDLSAIAPKIDEVTEVKEIDDSSYEIKGKQKGRLLFLFPVEIDVSYSLTDSAVTNVRKPWWSVFVNIFVW